MTDNDKDVFQGGKPENNTGYLMWQVSNIRQRIINNSLKDLELTYPQFVIISGIQWLKQKNETVNQVKLIHFTRMDKSVVSNVLKSLEKRAIVIREVDQMDTRAKILELSGIGLSKLERALVIMKEIDDVYFNKNKFDIESFNKVLIELFEKNK